MSAATPWLKMCVDATTLSATEATALEDMLSLTPGDLSVHIRLLGYWFANQGSDTDRHHAEHANWILSHYPDIDLGAFGEVDPEDIDGFAEGRRRWLRILAMRPDDCQLIRRAVESLSAGDRELAGYLNAIGGQIEPGSSYWPGSEARLMATAAIDEKDESRRTVLLLGALTRYDRAIELAQSSSERSLLLVSGARVALVVTRYDLASQLAARVLHEVDPRDESYVDCSHDAHIILGRVALESEDAEEAVNQLDQAARIGASPRLRSFGPDFSLASALLQQGEKTAVVGFLEASKKWLPSYAEVIDDWIHRVLRGEMPTFDNIGMPGMPEV